MCHTRAKCLLVVLFLSFGVKVLAQTGSTSNPTNGRENNPYSKFGIGELMNGNNTVLKGMGNVTSAFQNPYEVNSDNPASYSSLQRTTFEVGATASTRNIKGAGLSYTTGTATLSYLNLGLPVGKNAGMCFGFKPYSRTYYSMVDTAFNSPIGMVAKSYNGEGSLNTAYIGGAYKRKGFSFGFNVGYMFGNIRHTSATVPIDTAVINRAYTAEYTNYTRVGGLHWKGGVMYERKIDSDYTIRVGGTITLSQDLTEHFSSYEISSYNFGDTLVNDTTGRLENQKGKLRLPLSYSIGVMIAKNDKWNLGLDYTGTQWSGFNSSPDVAMNAGIASQAYKISLGGELTPDANNLRNYFSRITYRMGAYYGTDYLKIAGTQIPCYGITAGGSLPFRRSFSHLHLAFDVGRIGTTTNNLLQETYVRFHLGISFNDRWFIPRKYE
jgi:hypothetical protein